MIGLAHLSVAFAFFVGHVLVDLDHRPFVLNEMFRCIFKSSHGENTMRRGILHNWYFFYLLCSITLGVFIHLKMDGLI